MMGLKLIQNFYLKKQPNQYNRITKVGVEFLITKNDGTYINNCCFEKDDFLELARLPCFIGQADNFYMYDVLEKDVKQPIGFVPFDKKDEFIQNNDLLFYVKSREVLNYFDKKELERYRRNYRRLRKEMEQIMINDKWKCQNCSCEEFFIIEDMIEGAQKGVRVCKYCGVVSLTNI